MDNTDNLSEDLKERIDNINFVIGNLNEYKSYISDFGTECSYTDYILTSARSALDSVVDALN